MLHSHDAAPQWVPIPADRWWSALLCIYNLIGLSACLCWRHPFLVQSPSCWELSSPWGLPPSPVVGLACWHCLHLFFLCVFSAELLNLSVSLLNFPSYPVFLFFLITTQHMLVLYEWYLTRDVQSTYICALSVSSYTCRHSAHPQCHLSVSMSSVSRISDADYRVNLRIAIAPGSSSLIWPHSLPFFTLYQPLVSYTMHKEALKSMFVCVMKVNEHNEATCHVQYFWQYIFSTATS